MKCPFCKSKLEIKGKRRYETLGDHVSDPNMEIPPMRDYYECDCEGCQGGYWGEDGSIYTGYNNYIKICEFKYKLPNSYYSNWKSSLIGSWDRKYNRNNYYIELFRLKKIANLYDNILLNIYIKPSISINDYIEYKQAIKEIQEYKDTNMIFGEIRLNNRNDEVIKKLKNDGYNIERKQVDNLYQWYLLVNTKEN